MVQKGKGDAIVTYGTVSALYNGLTALNTKFDALLGVLAERKEVQDDHGDLIKAVEIRLTILETQSNTSRKFLNETWAVLFSVISLIISAIGGATSLIWHIR